MTVLFTKIKSVLGECYEQMYANKFDNLDEMGRSPTKTQTIENDSKKTENANRLIDTSSDKLPTKKTQVHMVLLVNYTKHLKKN